MCHESLKINFDVLNRNCFFIGGSNGSGKSALFAALNMGLGGRGSQNERGSTVKQYIKDGQNRAKIRIVLTNRGFGRYPGYGDAVVVERIINLTSSTYQLKSLTYEEGRCHVLEEVVSHKKSDLDKLLARFSIQLDNSIFWMSQNRCREFLQELKNISLIPCILLSLRLKKNDHRGENVKIEKLREDRKRLQNIEQNKRNLSELKSILRWLLFSFSNFVLIAENRNFAVLFQDLCKHNELLTKAVDVYTKLKEGFVAKEVSWT
uniref:AAA_23 domain-containing protein n=1 Tax=Elaeophora elaphi TaxID=1147741 RepID=A0A0R3RKN6_9BILA